MNRINRIDRRLRQFNHMRLALVLLPVAAVGTALAGTVLPARADTIRECSNYGVVRDRNDFEAPLLPKYSVANCARNYQTLDQTYRVVTPTETSVNDSSAEPSTQPNSAVDQSSGPATPNPDTPAPATPDRSR